MTRKRVERTLARLLGICALATFLGTADQAHARTRMRRYTPYIHAAGQCTVDYSGVMDQVAYMGGPVLSNVRAIPVFWTSAVDSTIQPWAQGYLETLVNSAYLDLLAQYSTAGQPGGTGQTIGHGTATAPATITPTMATGSTVMDSQIGPELAAQITAGHLPAPTMDAQGYSNALYIVFFPKGVTVSAGGNSCSGWCGYHAAYGGTNSKQQFAYAVIPDMGPGTGCDTGCASQCTTGDVNVSIGTVSHELAEAVTDPAGSVAWVNPSNSSMNSEIGDICTGSGGMQEDQGPVPGTTIAAQYEWSQKDMKCLLAPTGSSSGADAGSSTSSGSSSGSNSGSSGSSTSGSSSGTSSGSSSGSSSSGTTSGSSGSISGSSSGTSSSSSGSASGSSGSASGSTSGSSGGSNGGSSSGTGIGSSGTSGSDAGTGFGDMGAGNSSGCGCAMPGGPENRAGLAALAGLILLGAAGRRASGTDSFHRRRSRGSTGR